MNKKILLFIFFILFFKQIKAQNEFITVWKPNLQPLNSVAIDAPVQAGVNEIWFPGIGDNYTITWEEVNYPQHNGTMTNITSTKQVLINFGTPLNPIPANATYKVKASNGNGLFRQIQFGSNIGNSWTDNGNIDRILEIAQWGNIQWTSMKGAFANCSSLQLTASDAPDLSVVTDASYMFYNMKQFTGNPSMDTWNTSSIINFEYMFAGPPFSIQDQFDAPIGSWNTSAAENFSYMFYNNKKFNQNLNNWNTSNVTNMAYMFAETLNFNQPLNNWNTSNVTNMTFLFHFNPNFNQPLNNWNISNATDISHMFHGCSAFNQPLDSWQTNKVTTINTMFTGASHFNQNLENWNLPLLTDAHSVFSNSGINCTNYSKILSGWAMNPNTAYNINLGPLQPLSYSQDVVDKRNILIGKGWTFTYDLPGDCRVLSVSDSHLKESGSIYPNPAHQSIFIRNMPEVISYIILDASGRVIVKDSTKGDRINVESLLPGNYILQFISKEKIRSFKFVKK
ncbi:BspA family leucine-rich repeat surface protein [Chryseobacterium kwangjuense]|nr:BspA family leucine-rich repeat surface protein [Chryseobacterium kwangjuense]